MVEATQDKKESEVPQQLRDAVYVESVSLEGKEIVKGYDFNKGLDYNEVFKTYRHTGF